MRIGQITTNNYASYLSLFPNTSNGGAGTESLVRLNNYARLANATRGQKNKAKATKTAADDKTTAKDKTATTDKNSAKNQAKPTEKMSDAEKAAAIKKAIADALANGTAPLDIKI